MFWCVPCCVCVWEAQIFTKTLTERKRAARHVTATLNIVGLVKVTYIGDHEVYAKGDLRWKRGSFPWCERKQSSLFPVCLSPSVTLFFWPLCTISYYALLVRLFNWNSARFCLFLWPQMFQQPCVALSDSLIKLSPCSEWEPTTQPSE